MAALRTSRSVFLCLDFSNRLRQRLEVDLRQVQRRRPLARGCHAPVIDSSSSAVDVAHHLGDVRRVRVELGADGVRDRGEAGDAAGKLQRRRVGLHRPIQRGDQPLVAEEFATQRVGRDQRVHARPRCAATAPCCQRRSARWRRAPRRARRRTPWHRPRPCAAPPPASPCPCTGLLPSLPAP